MPSNGLWFYHTSSFKCPICGGSSDCRTNSFGGVHCRRGNENAPPVGFHVGNTDKLGFKIFWPDSNDARAWAGKFIQAQIDTAKENAKATGECKDKCNRNGPSKNTQSYILDTTEKIKRNRRDLTESERYWLADNLVLPTPIFDLLSIQYYEDDGHGHGGAYVIPERNALGEIVGWGLRFHDGTKRTYGGRGIFIPDGWQDIPGPIILPEGMSDTLALTSMGFAAIGRPSNLGGVEAIGELLKNSGIATDHNRTIIVLGENDLKPDGSHPGRTGAEKTAERLAEIIGRPVSVAYPMAGFKDVRDYVTANRNALMEKRTSLKQIGFTFFCHVTETARAFGAFMKSETISAILGYQPDGVTRIPPLSEQPVHFEPVNLSIDPLQATSTRCHNCRGVIMTHEELDESRFFWADCKKLDCPHCGPIKRKQYQATVTERLNDWEKDNCLSGQPAPLLWFFWCESADWQVVSNAIRRAKGDFFRLDLGGKSGNQGSLLIVTSVKPPEKYLPAARQIGVPEAVQRLCQTICLLPELRSKVFTTSKAWKLVSDDKPLAKRGWKRVGAFRCSAETVIDIMENSKVNWEPVGKEGRFWKWHAWQWKHVGVNVEHVYAQVISGQVMEEPNFEEACGLWDKPVGANVGAGASTGADVDGAWTSTAMPSALPSPAQHFSLSW